MLKSDYSTEEKRLITVGNRVVGSIEGSKFVKTVVGSRHRLRHPPAWCVSAQVFEEEIKPYATEIVIEDTEANIVYRTSLETFVRHCFEIQRGAFERQLGLALKHWDTTSNPRRQLSLLFEGGGSNV